MSEPDEKLIQEAVSGDANALSELLRRFGPRIHARIDGAIGRRYRSAFDASDVIQVTYMEAFLRIRRFVPAGVGSFTGWLEQIAENNLVDAIRELDRDKRPPRKRQLVAPQQQDTYVTLLGSLTGTTTTPSRHAGRSEARELIEKALAKLPHDYESVVRQLDLDGCPPAAVAELLGRSKGAVHMLRARAHDRLRELLGSASDFFTDTP